MSYYATIAARAASRIGSLTIAPCPPPQTLDYGRIFADMPKPAYVFDGRKILDHERLTKIGERVGGTVWIGLPGQCGRLPFDGLGDRCCWFS